MKLKSKCKNCGKEFYFYKSSVKNRGSFCSRRCKADFSIKNSGSTRICPICKKEFYIRGNPSKRPCCSRKCGAEYRKTGKIIKCEWCGKETYKPKSLLKNIHHFCSKDCSEKYQARNKKRFICKFCGREFGLSKSLAEQKGRNPTYCSIKCRGKDPEWDGHIKGNLAQQNKKGLNKLELAGKKILRDMGLNFQEQVLMFNKFLVDILIPEKNLIIQWDGTYWHSKPKRILLDKSQDAYLKKCGYKVLRITDIEMKNNKGKVYDSIQRAIR